MAQSDYIKYKRISTDLRIDTSFNKLAPVLGSQQYIDYLQYSIENKISTKKTVYNKLDVSGEQVVFGMEKKVTNCPSFITCINTNTRPNRVLNTSLIYNTTNSSALPFVTPQPLSIKATKNAARLQTSCKCKLNSKYTNKNICSCKTGDFGIVR
jgi:hypothetical protein